MLELKGFEAQVGALRQRNPEFAQLLSQHCELDAEVDHLNSQHASCNDQKKKRLRVKDAVFRILYSHFPELQQGAVA